MCAKEGKTDIPGTRAFVGGIRYHVISRGNGRRAVFHKDGDYQAFLKAMGHVGIEIPHTRPGVSAEN